ncbi:MAG: hypothetical protein ACI8ZM_004325 [Crocinitomix sp.]|jgi:hypothetical protein
MKMKIQFLIVLFLALPGSYYGFSQDTIRTNIIIDSLDNEVYYLTTKDRKPIAYFSPVFTPVCIDGTCYPIKINLFWDLAGNYLKYSLDAREILTKVEHLPFTEFDYGLLHRVIANHKSALANYTIYELVDTMSISEKEAKVDGVTGATRPELQGAFVPDALYTSYTLWHLARKPQLQIEAYTINRIFHSQLFYHVLTTPQLGGQELALHYLVKRQQTSSVIAVLSPIIDSTDNQLTVKCIELIPKIELELLESRLLLTQTYSRSDNSSVKKTILNRWNNEMKITPLELETIANELGNQSATFQLEQESLRENEDWTEHIYYVLMDKINNTSNMMRKERIKKLLYSREEDFPKKFRRKLKDLE